MDRLDRAARLAVLCLVVPALAACGGGDSTGLVDSGGGGGGGGAGSAVLVSMAGIDCG